MSEVTIMKSLVPVSQTIINNKLPAINGITTIDHYINYVNAPSAMRSGSIGHNRSIDARVAPSSRTTYLCRACTLQNA